MKKTILLFFIFLAGFVQNLFACHPVALINYQVQSGPGFIKVTADSDPVTCGCSAYYMDVEVVKASDQFTGTGFTIQGSGVYQYLTGPQFYTSTEMLKPDCIAQTYPWVTINYSDLCLGTTYKYRMREHHNSNFGPWSQEMTFTTPPASGNNGLALTAPNINVCYPSPVTLSATVTGLCGTPGTYSWSNGAGNSSEITVTPNDTISYIVSYITATDTLSDTLTLYVSNANGVLNGPSTVCNNDQITLTANGFTGTPEWLTSENGINWTTINGSGLSNTISISQSTYIKVSDSNGTGQCSDETTVLFVNHQTTPVITSSSSTSVCNNEPAILNVSGADSYSWSPSIGLDTTSGPSVTASLSQSITYTILGSNACGSDTAYSFLDVSPGKITIDSVAHLCSYSGVVTLFGNPTGGIFNGPGIMGTTFNPQSAGIGTHRIIYTVDLNSCTDTTSIFIQVNSCTGEIEHDESKINFFPNPVNKGEMVHFNNASVTEIRIYSVDGKFVRQPRLQNGEMLIDLSPGYYIVKAHTGDNITHFRMEVLE